MRFLVALHLFLARAWGRLTGAPTVVYRWSDGTLRPKPEPVVDDGFGVLARGLRSVVRFLSAGRDRFRVRGDWRLVNTGPDGVVKDVREWTQNLIVNAGLDLLKDRMFNPATAVAVVGNVAIGTGAVAEVATDIALGAEVARGATTYTAGGVGICTVDRTFAAGVGTGAITEAGLFNSGAGPTMFNRKVFAVVNKAAGDTLKVTCQLTVTPA